MLLCDWIMVIELCISTVILIHSIVISTRTRKYFNENVSKLAVRQRNSFLHSSLIFRFTHYWCILTSLLSTLVVLYIGCFEKMDDPCIKSRMIMYSALSLFTTVAPYAVNLIKLSNKYREAYCIVHAALLDGDSCADALKRAEDLISAAFSD